VHGQPRRGTAIDARSASLFRFVQFEFPWELGPPPGRYVLRDAAAEAALRVLVVSLLGAPERRLLGRRRRARRVAPEPPPAPVTTTRATVIRGQPVDLDRARAWLADAAAPVDAELAVLNRAIRMHRLVTADPAVREVRRAQALVVRVGYGRGEEVADGRWTEAVEPPPPRDPRRGLRAALRPQERLAALLGGRDAPLACEELALRARADVDAGRLREAALQLRVALEAAIAELEAWRDHGDMADRLAELVAQRDTVARAANAALRGGLDEATAAGVEHALGRVEAALRARTAGGIA
jgi:hypothetical protein